MVAGTVHSIWQAPTKGLRIGGRNREEGAKRKRKVVIALERRKKPASPNATLSPFRGAAKAGNVSEV